MPRGYRDDLREVSDRPKRPRGALLLFAKDPVPGRVKTRMVPPWSPEQAAGFFSCLLDDALEASARVAQRLGLEAFVYVDPPGCVANFESRLRALGLAAAGFCVRAQRGDTLGERMGRALAEVAAGGERPLLLRGCDSPTLSLGAMRETLEALESADLVLRPDADGGYSLVGLCGAPGDLFNHEMGHPDVLQQTLDRARARGLCCRLLSPGFDVDRVVDLERLARARAAGELESASRSLAFLDRERLWPPGAGS